MTVKLNIETLYPADGQIRITVESESQKEFSIKFRLPAWCQESSITPSGANRGNDGYLAIRRHWKSGDTIKLNLKLEPRLVLGDHLNEGKAALFYGPLVLAADESLLADAEHPLKSLALSKPDVTALAVTPEPALANQKTWAGAQSFRFNATARNGGASFVARLVPFADAGITGMGYKVWLPLAGQPNGNVLLDGSESRSRQGNQSGSINDDDPHSFVTTFDGKPAGEVWFGVTLARPVTASRVIFTHGKNFHDGGWFDTSAGKPRVQVQRTVDSAWDTVGELSDYPATTAAKGQHDRLTWGNRQFTLKLAKPVSFVALRVIGVPSCGDNSQQAFASCAELQAFGE